MVALLGHAACILQQHSGHDPQLLTIQRGLLRSLDVCSTVKTLKYSELETDVKFNASQGTWTRGSPNFRVHTLNFKDFYSKLRTKQSRYLHTLFLRPTFLPDQDIGSGCNSFVFVREVCCRYAMGLFTNINDELALAGTQRKFVNLSFVHVAFSSVGILQLAFLHVAYGMMVRSAGAQPRAPYCNKLFSRGDALEDTLVPNMLYFLGMQSPIPSE
jgi:hypothetical protein